MPELSIEIIRRGDPPPLWHQPFDGEAEVLRAYVLESGMASGAPSIGLYFTTPDGKCYLAQTSWNIIDGLAGAGRGLLPAAPGDGALPPDTRGEA